MFLLFKNTSKLWHTENVPTVLCSLPCLLAPVNAQEVLSEIFPRCLRFMIRFFCSGHDLGSWGSHAAIIRLVVILLDRMSLS